MNRIELNIKEIDQVLILHVVRRIVVVLSLPPDFNEAARPASLDSAVETALRRLPFVTNRLHLKVIPFAPLNLRAPLETN